ncbi:related to dipeptidyl aminopeptidase B [Cephalotrichum gorgonifer]|uniref:Probable dipeptidyl-aminopeptidase B n=1 Tax=Cephalotrichum gorgonifer TaxID=2041049 RepID=A0AAE8N931_9PEZI|nr:related to dipeptidyl aminopeptidase B [Cephalotrichum gorgonifer]
MVFFKSSFAAAALLCVATLTGAAKPPGHGPKPHKPHKPGKGGGRLLTYNETTPSAKIRPSSQFIDWSSAGEDGQYITTNAAGDLILEDIVTGNSTTFLPGSQLPENLQEYWISADATRVLIAANATKQYRYTYFADYFILDVASGESVPLVDDQAGDIQFAGLAPTGDVVAFVRGNNLYLRDHATGEIKQITEDGGPDLFHGVPDWVYEEEIFGTTSTLWFSPDAKFIAFLSFNETGVDTFTIPYYMAGQKLAPPYPEELELRYPKVGSKNPTVQLSILDVASGSFEVVPVDAFPPEELIIGEVAWVTDAHDALIYRAFNRVQDRDAHVVVDPASLTSKVVRERDGTDGWLENTAAISYVGALGSDDDAKYYVDLSDESGWAHIYLYPVAGGDPIQLTSGEWEVAGILKVDAERGTVSYSATTHHSTERHLYRVSWRDEEITPLVDDKVAAYWSASFSTGGGYYILSYLGPDVPFQELYSSNDTSSPLRTIQDNAAFIETIAEYNLPEVTYFELEHPDGYSLNVQQQLPPNFDPKKKYPVLFTPYGGPNSQEVSKRWTPLDWEFYVSSDPELQYVVYKVDNRGTGFRGRAYRSAVAGHLGKLEPLDQIWAAEQLIAKNKFIDADRFGMWGWSYGGYLTAKTLEADSGVFSFGLITAPVSDWRFYDSMYTERYMKTLQDNEQGYLDTAVHNVAGFKNVAGGFSVLHGTGDDNVHYQHTAALVDLLVGGGVTPEKMKLFAFTDSDHSINYNGASAFLYKYLTARLFDEVKRDVKGKGLVHQWSKKSADTSE